jgi:hypothetical protein
MRILSALLICVFSSTLSAQTWEDISVAWKTEVGSISSSCTGIYEIEILSSGEKPPTKVEHEIARSGSSFYSIQKRDGSFISVSGNNSRYSFQLGRIKGQDEWSIIAVNPSCVTESEVWHVLCREGYGSGANLLCLPVVWRELLFMTEPSNFSSMEMKQGANLLEVNFVINKDVYTSGLFPFEEGKLLLQKDYPFLPSKMELVRKGEVISGEMVEMMIKSGVRGSDGEPVTKSLAGQKMDDGKLIAEWTYSAEGRVLEPQKLEVSGNAYSQYKISRTDANVVYNDDKAFLTHWGFAEPTGMPSRSGLGLWGWIIIGVIGLAVVVFVYFKPRGNR